MTAARWSGPIRSSVGHVRYAERALAEPIAG